MSLVNKASYTSKSILSVLQPNPTAERRSEPLIIDYLIPSSIFLVASLIGLWAFPFYLILGLCYKCHSAILLEDLHLDRLRSEWNENSFRDELFRQFNHLTRNCFIASCLSLLLLLLSQFVLHCRRTHPNPK